MCYSRRKSTQFCNINIAIRGIFVFQTAIIIIFNTNLPMSVLFFAFAGTAPRAATNREAKANYNKKKQEEL